MSFHPISLLSKGWRIFVSDQAVRYASLSKFAAIALGPLTVITVGLHLSPAQQGIYYVFISLLQLRVFIDMGFSQSAVQSLSLAFGGLRYSRPDGISGEDAARGNYLKLGSVVCKAYSLIGLLTFLLIGMAGWWYLQSSIQDFTGAWVAPWWFMIGGVGLGLSLQGPIVVAESANLLNITNKWRLIADVLATLIFVGTVFVGGGLWGCAAMAWSRTVILTTAMAWQLGMPLLSQLQSAAAASLQYLKGYLPLHARNSVTQISGFILYYSYTPMALSLTNASTAGIVGMTLQISNMVYGFSIVWLAAKTPHMGNLAGSRDRSTLLGLYTKGARITAILWLLLMVAALGGSAWLKHFFPSIGHRFGSSAELAVFLGGSAGLTFYYVRALLIRVHCREPFAVMSLVQAAITIALLAALLPRWGVMGGAVAYFASQAVGAAWSEWEFRKFRRLEFNPQPVGMTPPSVQPAA